MVIGEKMGVPMEGARKVRKINNTWYIMKLNESLGRIATDSTVVGGKQGLDMNELLLRRSHLRHDVRS